MEVSVDRENFEKAVRQFHRMFNETGLRAELARREYFISRGQRRRLKIRIGSLRTKQRLQKQKDLERLRERYGQQIKIRLVR